MTLLTLRTGRLAVELAPAAGGAVARFTCDGVDMLRPMTAADVASGKGNNAALYPLVPFSNRIRDGRLVFEGETFQLARNWPGVGHPMHGDGWAHAWDVVRSDAQSAEIAYEHERAGDEGGWPFRYRARQTLSPRGRPADDPRSRSRISRTGRCRPASACIRSSCATPTANSRAAPHAVWRTDAEVLPIDAHRRAARLGFQSGRAASTA